MLDPYQPGDSLLHRLEARIKVGLALGWLLALNLTPAQAGPLWILWGALAVVMMILGELRALWVLSRLVWVLPLVLATLPLAWTTPGAPWARLPWGLVLTIPGLVKIGGILLKASLSLLVAVILTATTPTTQLLTTLQSYGVPRLLVATGLLMWRYLAVLVDEAQRLLRARAARSGTWPGARPGALTWRARVTGGLAGNLILRGLARAEQLYAAMVARGYTGELRTWPTPPLSLKARWGLGAGWVILAGLALSGQLWH